MKKTKTGNLMNPTDSYRKEIRRRELKRNKKERKKVREVGILKKDPETLKEQIMKLESMKAEGALDKTRRHKKRQLEDTLNLVLKKRKEFEEKVKESGEAVMFSHLPCLKKNSGEPILNPKPEDSIYYHPTLNPTGMPPPGKPAMYKPTASRRSDATSSSPSENDKKENELTAGMDPFIPLPLPPPPPVPSSMDSLSTIPLPLPIPVPPPPPSPSPSSSSLPSASMIPLPIPPPPPQPLEESNESDDSENESDEEDDEEDEEEGESEEEEEEEEEEAMDLLPPGVAPTEKKLFLPPPPPPRASNSASEKGTIPQLSLHLPPPPPRTNPNPNPSHPPPPPPPRPFSIPPPPPRAFPLHPNVPQARPNLPPPPPPPLLPPGVSSSMATGMDPSLPPPPPPSANFPQHRVHPPPFPMPMQGARPLRPPPGPPGQPPSGSVTSGKPSYVKSAAPTVVKRPLAQHTPELTAMVPASVRVKRESAVRMKPRVVASTRPFSKPAPATSTPSVKPASLDESYSAFLEDMKELGAFEEDSMQ